MVLKCLQNISIVYNMLQNKLCATTVQFCHHYNAVQTVKLKTERCILCEISLRQINWWGHGWCCIDNRGKR